jgi:SAM-dependent methyltransferase
MRTTAARLFLTSATLLFVELLLIRWIPANVLFFGYFNNIVLMASFLGIGIGILYGRARPAGSGRRLPFPPFAPLLLCVVAVVGTLQLNVQLLSPDQLFFGLAESSTSNIGFVVVPVVVALVTILMASLALPLGPLLTSMPPLRAYGVDVAGSMAGIAGFALLSALSTPPPIWFAVLGGLLALLAAGKPITRWSVLTGAAITSVVVLSVVQASGTIWSPYYRINVFRNNGTEIVNVNGIPHQYFATTTGATLFPFYYQIYDWLPGRTFDRVLVVGAGTGNDVAIALAHGAKSVDAVEIDPVIAAIGARDNPTRPYSDPRVTRTINDGRAALRNTDTRYDLIVFALPDSLTLVSSTANIRLESFLFTDEAFTSVRDHLAPGGVFVLYNFYREHWLVDKIAFMLQQTFGAAPLVATYPQLGNAAAAMADGPGTATAAARGAPSTGTAGLAGAGPSVAPPIPATDDWPFLYLLTPSIAPIYLVAMLLVLLWAGLLIWRASAVSGTSFRRFSPHFFLLGVAFMLLETRSLVTFSLLFGTTWLVNALVFFAILAGVLAAILVNARLRIHRPEWLYLGLFGALALAYALPPATLLIDPPWLRYVVASAIAFAPVFLANLVFTYSFRDTRTADTSFASNLLGAMVGAVLEYVSLVTGYQALLLLVAVIYLLAFLTARRYRFLADVDLVAAGRSQAA